MKCLVCNSSQAAEKLYELSDRLLGMPGTFSFYRCRVCQAVAMDPQPTVDELVAYYPKQYYESYTQLFEPRSAKRGVKKFKAFLKYGTLEAFRGYGTGAWWKRIILAPFFLEFSFVPRLVTGGRLLEVGCGTGGFLKLMEELGWEVHGCDIAPEACRIAKDELGLRSITVGGLKSLTYPDNHFDAITLHHVFEHLPHPKQATERLYRLLKSGGELTLSMPNTRSWVFKIFGRNWFALDVPRHFILYNSINASLVLREAGFEIERVITNNAFGGLVNSFELKRGKMRDSLGFLHKPLYVLKFLFEPIVNLLGVGDQLIIRARKPEVAAK